MKDFLLVLFYQAIVAVNTAVILNAIIWLAKRKEKREKNPNQDFTPLPAKKPPKPPTTGTNVITPEEDKSDYFSCLRSVFPGNLTREQVLDGLERYIKGYNPDRIFDQFENEMRERAKRETQCVKTEPIKGEYFTKEIRGGLGNQLLATVTANSEEGLEEKLKTLADAFDRTDKKPVTPERLKEAGFETEYLNAKCEECENWKRDGQIFGHCTLRRCPVKAYERRQCQFFKKWEPKPETALEAMCRNCKHFQTTDEWMGLCEQMDEIVFANSYRACFEPRKTGTERKCGNCVYGIAPLDDYVFCVAEQGGVKANGIKAENCKWWEKRTAPLETAEKDWSKSKSCENCRFSTENDRPNPNTVTCHFKQNHPVLRPRDGSCWTCENYEPKPSTSKVEPKPAKPARSEKSCDNCDYSFVKDAKHSGCFTSALGFPCGSFKPIERPAPLGTDATH